MKRRNALEFAGMSMALMTLHGCQRNGANESMYGLIGQFIAAPGKRDELINVLLTGTKNMPGCLSYVVSKDLENEHALWITEVWDSQDSHKASLSLPPVQQAMDKGKPMISELGHRYEIAPVGGHGL